MKISRRGLLVMAGASTALAQGPQPPADKPDPVAAAREENRRSAEALAKFEIPMSTEPAFIFKP